MKINITGDWGELTVSNEQLDNINFVDLYTDKMEEEITIPIDELLSAITAFKTLKDERKEMQLWQKEKAWRILLPKGLS